MEDIKKDNTTKQPDKPYDSDCGYCKVSCGNDHCPSKNKELT